MDDFPAIEFPPAILENIDTVRFLMAGPLTAETTRGIVSMLRRTAELIETELKNQSPDNDEG